MIERPDERRAHQKHEREVREVVERWVVDHRPEEHRRVEVVRGIRVHPVQQLARGFLDHERAVVDVRVWLPRLAKHDRGDRGENHERGDDRDDVHEAGACGESLTGASIAERVGEREGAAGDQKGRIRARWEELPERDVTRGRHRRMVREQEKPVAHAEYGHDLDKLFDDADRARPTAPT